MNRWLILIFAFLLFAGMLIGEDITTVEKLAAECSAGNQEACKKLADIAKNDKDDNLRKAAVNVLTDQTVLAKFAIEDMSVGHIAMQKIASQAATTKANADDKDWRVRLILKFKSAFDSVPSQNKERLMAGVWPAIQVLNYPEVVSVVGDIVSIKIDLEKTYKEYRTKDGRLYGIMPGEIFFCSIKVHKLPEPIEYTWTSNFPDWTESLNFLPVEVNANDLVGELLAYIHDKNHKKPLIFKAAVEFPNEIDAANINDDDMYSLDQSVLADIARNHKSYSVREAAVRKLTDKVLLVDICKNDNNYNVRSAAEKRLKELQGK
jgi:hypothetical protein